MSSLGSPSPLLFGAAKDYEIERSLRFEAHGGSAAGANLQRTFGNEGNTLIWTFSCWAKKTGTGGEQVIFNGGGGGNGNTTIRWDTDDSFHIFEYNSGYVYRLHTNKLFRDPAAWYHIVLAFDTTQDTADNRIKLYVNGVEETSFANRTNPALDIGYTLNKNIQHTIGNNAVTTVNANYFNGYLTDVYFIDGLALDASSFGETNTETGAWIPKKYEGDYGQVGSGTYHTGSQVTGSAAFHGAFNLFDGDLNTTCGPTALSTDSSITFTPTSGIAYSSSIRIYAYGAGSGYGITNTFELNGGSPVTFAGDAGTNAYIWVDVASGSGTLTSLKVRLQRPGTSYVRWAAIEIDGTILKTNGVNGYYLNFSDNSDTTATTLGKDSSGNGNNWTPNNLSVATTFAGDSMPDTPTNNLCTINSIYKGHNNLSTFTQGNLHVNTANVAATSLANIAIPQTGKWFCEVKMTDLNSEGSSTGWIGVSTYQVVASPGQPRTAYYGWNGYKYVRNASSDTNSAYGASYGLNDVIGVAVNMDDDEITFYKNGTSQGTISSWRAAGVDYFFMVGDGGSAGSTEYELNFGQKAFLHTKPTGYKILSVKNLAEPTIKKGTDHFNTVLYTGTGNTNTNAVTGVGFTPNLVWCKDRSNAFYHGLWDTVRGVSGNNSRFLVPSESFAEGAGAVNSGNPYLMMNSLDADGFTLGATSPATASVNHLNDNFVSWNWLGNSSNVSNSDGDIDSTVNVNTTAGFSIGTFSGTGSAGTIGHGLGVAPKFILIKNRESANSWAVYHDAIGADQQLLFNSSNAITSDADGFNEVPTSTVINVGSGAQMDTNKSGGAASHVFYAFSEVEGFSKFGSYLGNGNADGTFIYTGFKPAWVITKRTVGGTSNWNIFDNKRPGFNLTNDRLFSNLNNAETESSGTRIDLLSNGFKMRGDNVDANGSGSTYVYMAFAETSFKYANAF